MGTAFTPEEVVRLWQYQFGPWRDPFDIRPSVRSLPLQMHPFTCGKRGDHPVMAGDKGVLVPTVRGWICPFCDYTQGWAHGFMKGTAQGIEVAPASETPVGGSTSGESPTPKGDAPK